MGSVHVGLSFAIGRLFPTTFPEKEGLEVFFSGINGNGNFFSLGLILRSYRAQRKIIYG